MQCPFLRYDKAFRDFMDMKENDKNQGEMMLAMAFGRLSSPTNPLVRYMVLKEEVAAMEKFGNKKTSQVHYLLLLLQGRN